MGQKAMFGEAALREKVDSLLEQALAETDLKNRTHLIGKAAYWARVAEREAAPIDKVWRGYARARYD